MLYPCCQIKEVVFISSHNIISWKSRDLRGHHTARSRYTAPARKIYYYLLLFFCISPVVRSIIIIHFSMHLSSIFSHTHTLTYNKHIIIVIYTMDEVRYWRHAPTPMYFCHGGHSAARQGTRRAAALFIRYILSFEVHPYHAPQHERNNSTTQNQVCGGKN